MHPTGSSGFQRPMTLQQIVEPISPVGRAFALVVQVLILLSLVAFSVETLPTISDQTRLYLYYFEVFSVAFFTIEYILRTIAARPTRSYIFSFLGIVDLLAILPFYITSGVDLRSIRILRMFRLIRIFKLVRYSDAMQRFAASFRLIRSELMLFMFACLALLFVASVGIYHFEGEAQPETFGSVFHCMWWAVETLTTVGYGDVFPITIGGRVFTAAIVFIGLGIVAVPAGLIAGALSQTIAREEREAIRNQKTGKGRTGP